MPPVAKAPMHLKFETVTYSCGQDLCNFAPRKAEGPRSPRSFVSMPSSSCLFLPPHTQMHDFPTVLSSNLLKQNETAILIDDASGPTTTHKPVYRYFHLFSVAFWHPACFRMTGEAIDVRRCVCLLLTVFVVQLSGLRTLCVPSHSSSHPCCPMSTNTTPPSSSSLPACCVNFLLNYQGSLTETQSAGDSSGYTAQLGEMSHPSAAPRVATSAPVRQHMLPSVSPPLSPLSQSCLLLI